MKLAALKGRDREILIPIPSEEEGEPDDEVKVIYRPGVLTIDIYERIAEMGAGEGASDAGAVAELLSNVLVSWEIEDEDEDGNTYQLGTSVEDIRKVPLPFIGQVLDAITNEVVPNPQSAGSSDAASPSAEKTSSFQPGTN